jgi:hypothetical protein
MSEYNTQREKLILKEYGRNIQKLVAYISTVEDKEKRDSYAAVLVDLMRQINPNINENTEYNQKLWDDLFIMSDFKLDATSPYPVPEEEVLTKKPQRVAYKMNRIRYKHYGKNIELIINKAIETEDPKEKEAFIIYLGKLMKTFYSSWNKEVVSEDVIIDHIEELSKNKLSVDRQKVKDGNLFEVLYKDKPSNKHGGKKDSGGKRSGGNNKKRRRN